MKLPKMCILCLHVTGLSVSPLDLCERQLTCLQYMKQLQSSSIQLVIPFIPKYLKDEISSARGNWYFKKIGSFQGHGLYVIA